MINVIIVPAFQDNYLWLFHRQGSDTAYAVDPGEAAPIEQALRKHRLQLAGILITHHHADHIGGVNALLQQRDIPVYGPLSSKIPAVSRPLADGDLLTLDGGEISFRVLAVPGHTLEHIAYFNPDEHLLFCGDTLFAAGCGRMFEGNPVQMQNSLQKLADLPADTTVYCAHEYTLANLKFALQVEQNNPALLARQQEAQRLRAANQPTVPSRLSLELATNPFLRVTQRAVIEAASAYNGRPVDSPAEVFAALRRWKDNF